MGFTSSTRAVQNLEFDNNGNPRNNPVQRQPKIPVPDNRQYSMTRFMATSSPAGERQDLGFRNVQTAHEAKVRMAGILEHLNETLPAN
ncbi:hypothetical protein VM1G_11515 [Cytospora mali]|uniref:Uncharacterized protein n=1 Tax=Cytospora mali TaxID=578113 RepID=A0A194VUL8_CYTMA|nr:hypothetical protein VM1G_11515 [Valsa mali]